MNRHTGPVMKVMADIKGKGMKMWKAISDGITKNPGGKRGCHGKAPNRPRAMHGIVLSGLSREMQTVMVVDRLRIRQ